MTDETFITLHEAAEGVSPSPRKSNASRGRNFGAFVAAMLYARRHNTTRRKAAQWAEERLWNPSVAKALNTTGSSTGGAIVPQAFSTEIIELLRAETVIRRCQPVTMEMPSGNLTIPRLCSASTAGFQEELDDVPTSQPSFDDLSLNAKKLTALVPVSNDLLRRAPSDVAEIVRDDFVATMGVREDLAFLTGDGSKGSPIGLLNYVPPANSIVVAPFSSLDNETVGQTTMGVLLGMRTILANSMSRMIRPRWISTPGTFAFLRSLRDDFGSFLLREEMDRGLLLGSPFFQTQQLPANLTVPFGSGTSPVGANLLLVDFADVVLADTLRFTRAITETTVYPDSSGVLVSTFARDLTVYRAISEFDFNVRHAGSIAVALLPAWVPAGTQFFASGASSYVQAEGGYGSAAASTWGLPPTGSNNPGNVASVMSGGTLPGRS